jgi:(4-(4-[2-(gamma-L-glutamylamino)ethyl]phenoxymethyl)furan-2-yl)methanamine synthase
VSHESPRTQASFRTLGLDIGGANLKAVHSDGSAISQPFALWRDPAGLLDALRRVCAWLAPADLLAVTMTGELCDCFESKRQGVATILDAVEAVAQATPVRVWCNEGCFLDLAAARRMPLQTAAANWLALATFVGRFAPYGPALLIDIGSTTTDLVPLFDGKPVPKGRIDPQRLQCGELVYTGARRTPLCALLNGEGAAELFATTLDAYLVLGQIAENPHDCNTADGRPATRPAAEVRLARMLCGDLETSTQGERVQLAESAAARQRALINCALDSVLRGLPSPPHTLILAGEGEFLAEQVTRQRPEFPGALRVSLSRELGDAISLTACAHAVAVLAAEGA